MKKTIYILALTLVTMTTNAQITLENSYPSMPTIVHLSLSGYKYCVFGDTTKLYNLNHSLWKSINLYVPSGGYLEPNSGYHSISEELYNSDTLIEILYLVEIPPTSASVYVTNETGSILFQEASGYGQAPQIVNDGIDFKMMVFDSTTSRWNVYGLTGTLPCNLCGGTLGITEHNSNGNKQMISNPYPNPTNDKTTINYELPEGINQGKLICYDITGNIVKAFIVDRTFKNLQISNSDLASGTYYYQLQTTMGASGGKKLVIIK